MVPTKKQRPGSTLLLTIVGWCLCLAAWTAALLTSSPVEVGKEVVPSGMEFPAAKLLHVCVYGFLALCIFRMPLGRWRWLPLAVLSLHAAGTEFLQRYIPGRTGKVADVFIDHFGILLGFALAWKLRSMRSAKQTLLPSHFGSAPTPPRRPTDAPIHR